MKSQSLKKEKLTPQQSDIVIHPNGSMHISFLWDDLNFLRSELAGIETHEIKKPSIDSVDGQIGFPELPHPLEEYQSCHLCPKRCGFDRLARSHPTCGNYELRIGSSGLTMGDEPEISGVRGSGAIMLSGCPLRCPSCHNPEMVADGQAHTIADFVELTWQLKRAGAHNIQILSPTVHLPPLRIALEELKRSQFNLPIIFKSSGYEDIKQLQRFEGLVDIYLPDLKFGPCSSWGKRAGVKNYFEVAKEAISEMFRQVGPLVLDDEGRAIRGLLVRHVKAPIPEEERAELLSFLTNLDDGVRVSVMDNFVNLE